jgi:hypothetical protein
VREVGDCGCGDDDDDYATPATTLGGGGNETCKSRHPAESAGKPLCWKNCVLTLSRMTFLLKQLINVQSAISSHRSFSLGMPFSFSKEASVRYKV